MASEGLPSVLPVTDCGAKAPPRTEGLVNRSPFFGNTHLAHSSMVGFSGFLVSSSQCKTKRAFGARGLPQRALGPAHGRPQTRNWRTHVNETKRALSATFNTYEGALRPTLSMQSHDARAPGSQLSCRPPPARTFLNSSCTPRASGGLTTTAGGVRGCSSSHSAATCKRPPFSADPHVCPTVAVHTLMIR